MKPDFKCTKIVKYYNVAPLKRGHPSFKNTFSLQNGRDGNISGGLLYTVQNNYFVLVTISIWGLT